MQLHRTSNRHSSGGAGKRGRDRRSLAVGAILVTIAASMLLTTAAADARPVATFAQIECLAGQVRFYAPNFSSVATTHPNSRVYIGAQLQVYTSSGWANASNGWSGWWAYGNTTTLVQAGGLYGLSFFSFGNLAWFSSGLYSSAFGPDGRAINYQSPSLLFNVQRGQSYRVVTWLYDAADGSQAWLVNTATSYPGAGSICNM